MSDERQEAAPPCAECGHDYSDHGHFGECSEGDDCADVRLLGYLPPCPCAGYINPNDLPPAPVAGGEGATQQSNSHTQGETQ